MRAVKGARFSILGIVREEADNAHVVIRGNLQLQGIPFSSAEVRSAHRTAAGWRLLLPPSMHGMIAGFKAAIAKQGT